MKTIIKKYSIMLLGVIGLTISCSSDVDLYGDSLEGEGNFSSFKWFTSGTRESYDDRYKEINVDSYVAFYDVSHGVKNRKWTIPSSAKFLNKEFGESDSIYTSFILPNQEAEYVDPLANILFTEGGIFDIKLSNEFKTEGTFETIIKDGELYKDTTIVSDKVDFLFTVKVFPNPEPTCKVLRENYDSEGNLDPDNPFVEVLVVTEEEDPQAADIETWEEISIEAGEKLQFIDLSKKGEVNNRAWHTMGGTPETENDSVATITYNKLTEEGKFNTVYFESIRTATAGPLKSVSKLIPLKINVIPSTKPFQYVSGIKVGADGVISFPVTGEVENFSGQEDRFTVLVENIDAGFSQNIPVESVSLKSGDATTIELKLAELVYNTDTFTISYTDDNLDDANGIISVDGRSLESFGPVLTKVELSDYDGGMNIEDYTGYESVYTGSGNQFKQANMAQGLFWAQHNANNVSGPLYYWRDTEKAYDGESALKFETPATGIPNLARLQGSKFKTISPVAPGKYIASVWVYIDPATNMTNFQYNFTDKAEATFNFDISSVEKGKWVLLTLPAVDLPAINAGRLDINITKTGQDDAIVQKLWLDNFDLLIVNDRP